MARIAGQDSVAELQGGDANQEIRNGYAHPLAHEFAADLAGT